MPRLLSTLPMEKDGIFYGIFLIYIKISFYSNILQYSSIPALAYWDGFARNALAYPYNMLDMLYFYIWL